VPNAIALGGAPNTAAVGVRQPHPNSDDFVPPFPATNREPPPSRVEAEIPATDPCRGRLAAHIRRWLRPGERDQNVLGRPLHLEPDSRPGQVGNAAASLIEDFLSEVRWSAKTGRSRLEIASAKCVGHTRLSAMPNRWQGHAIPRLGGRSRPDNAPDFCTTKALGIQPSRFGA
jgi:hypothetical protein